MVLLFQQVKGIFCFHVKGGPGGSEAKWIVDAKNGSGSVEKNGPGKRRNIPVVINEGI